MAEQKSQELSHFHSQVHQKSHRDNVEVGVSINGHVGVLLWPVYITFVISQEAWAIHITVISLWVWEASQAAYHIALPSLWAHLPRRKHWGDHQKITLQLLLRAGSGSLSNLPLIKHRFTHWTHSEAPQHMNTGCSFAEWSASEGQTEGLGTWGRSWGSSGTAICSPVRSAHFYQFQSCLWQINLKPLSVAPLINPPPLVFHLPRRFTHKRHQPCVRSVRLPAWTQWLISGSDAHTLHFPGDILAGLAKHQVWEQSDSPAS